MRRIRKKNDSLQRKVIVKFLYLDAQLDMAKLTKDTLLEFGWIVLCFTWHSPDLIPSDYYFQSQYILSDRKFKNVK